MSDPIVTPLVDRLSLTSWLKPLFIHPSVTAGAAENMRDVRRAQERLADERKEQADRAKINAALLAIEAVVHPKDAVDFQADVSVVEQIRSNLKYLQPEPPVVAQPIRVSKENDDEEDHFTAPVARERHISELNQGLEAIFLDALKIQNEVTKKALLDAIAKANPKYKAYVDISAILAQPESERNETLYGVVTALQSNRHHSFDEKLKALYKAIKDLNKDTPINAPLIAAAQALKPVEATVHSDVRGALPAVNLESKWTIALGSFWRAIGFHGYDKSSTVLTTARGKKFYFQDSNRWHTLAAFMGLPSRVDSEGNTAVFSARTFARALFGGWVSLYNPDSVSENRRLATSNFWMFNPRNYTLEGQRFWNLVLLLTGVKFVIAAYYTVTFPVKLALNIVRQVTETLPEALLNYSGKWYGDSASTLLTIHYAKAPFVKKLIAGAFQALILIVSFSVHQVARLAAIVGTAATSPQESAREAWKTGLALDSRFRLVVATLLALSSIALTAVIWALTFPVLFAKALVVFPALAPVVTSISQLPIVASTIAYVNGSATLVAGTLPAAFSTAATAISTAFGVTVSATTLAVATIWAVIAAPVATIATASANYLSNAWTKWNRSWTLLEAGSQAAAHVAISANTAFLQLLPSAEVTKLANGYEKAYWGSVDSEKLLAAKNSENLHGRFNARKENYETLEFPAAESSRNSKYDLM